MYNIPLPAKLANLGQCNYRANQMLESLIKVYHMWYYPNRMELKDIAS